MPSSTPPAMAMNPSTSYRVLLTALLISGALGVVVIALTLAQQILAGPSGARLLFAWSALFAVVLPVGVTVAAILTQLISKLAPRRMGRSVGFKIPEAGQ